MKWQEMIQKGMKLIAEGCARNMDWTKCEQCPFDSYCSFIYEEEEKTPVEWKFDD